MNRTDWLRVSGAISCVVLTLSIVYPFLQVRLLTSMRYIGPMIGPQTYWSFKAAYIIITPPNHTRAEEYWLQDYWSRYTNRRTAELGLRVDVTLTLMLTTQILALLFATLATIKVKPYLFLTAALLSILTALLMWLTSTAFAYSLDYTDPQCTFQPGFWLTFAAAALFLTFFLTGQPKTGTINT